LEVLRMSRNLIRFSIPLVGSAAIALAFLGCSSDKTSPANDGGSSGGATSSGGASSGGKGGGGTAGGGTSGTGGAGKGGSGGAGKVDAGPDPYVCLNTPSKDPGGPGAANATCCGGIGKCVDAATVTDAKMKAALGHDTCATALLCAPPAASAADAGPGGAYSKCTAHLGAALEGRCLPKCFLIGNPQVSQLAQETCDVGMLCAPCYSPLDASDTGACSQKPGDAPTAAAPVAYASCGAFDGGPKGGLCVPKVLVDASGNASAPSLKQDDCANATDRCVPTLKAKDTAACFAKCSSGLGGSLGAQYEPGACVPTYIVTDVAGAAGLAIVKKGSCTGEGELCAPCADPLHAGMASHACE
jgi:hypothetical protein